MNRTPLGHGVVATAGSHSTLLPSSSATNSAKTMTSLEQLIYRLCVKLAASNNLNDKFKEQFVNTSFPYLIKLLASDSYSPVCDRLEISEKIKKKLIQRKRQNDAVLFNELETAFSKSRVIKNQAPILQFFYTIFQEKSKFDTLSNKNSLMNVKEYNETPAFTEHIQDNLVDKSLSTKRIIELFKPETKSNLNKENQILKPAIVPNEVYILRELLYSFQGIDGQLFHRDPQKDVIVTKVALERTVQLQVNRFLECGWLYSRLRKFVMDNNNKPTTGLILQAFCAYISSELKEYHRLLAVLESQLGNKDESGGSGSLTLRRLMVWLEQPIDRLKYLNIVCDAVKDKKGGVLLSTLHSYSIHGDPHKSALLKSALAKCAVPIRDMIIEWICDGQIRDAHFEFFIAGDNSVTNDLLWHNKYKLRTAQIPSFIREDQAKKILLIGKTINFLRVVCNEQKQIKKLKNIPSIESMLEQNNDFNFQETIDAAYKETSSALIEILMNKYKLLDHYNALRGYLLLGKGDFIRHLMDLMEAELNKPANELMFHTLTRLLDKAITETNAQFDPSYIISKLEVKLLTNGPSDLGWDVFTLNYNMDTPIKTIFTNDVIMKYLRVFNFLWRVKRLEYKTCATWMSHKANMEKFRSLPEVYDIIHQGNIISSEMLRLLQNLNFYIMFEVLEVSWKNLCEKLNDAKDMDHVIAATDQFLDIIISQLLLDPQSNEISSELRTVFDLINKMSALNESLFELALKEFHARKQYRSRVNEGMSEDELREMEDIERRRYNTEVRPKIKTSKSSISILKTSFNEMVRKLLEMLKKHNNDSLRFLSFRFNFNEYYN